MCFVLWNQSYGKPIWHVTWKWTDIDNDFIVCRFLKCLNILVKPCLNWYSAVCSLVTMEVLLTTSSIQFLHSSQPWVFFMVFSFRWMLASRAGNKKLPKDTETHLGCPTPKIFCFIHNFQFQLRKSLINRTQKENVLC